MNIDDDMIEMLLRNDEKAKELRQKMYEQNIKTIRESGFAPLVKEKTIQITEALSPMIGVELSGIALAESVANVDKLMPELVEAIISTVKDEVALHLIVERTGEAFKLNIWRKWRLRREENE